MRFFPCHGAMFNAARNYDELAGINRDNAIAKFDAKSAMNAQEQLIFKIVMMPDKLPLELDQLDLLSVQLADNLWSPMFGNLIQLVGNVDLVHLQLLRVGFQCCLFGNGMKPMRFGEQSVEAV